MEDTIRVLRVLEYVGPRSMLEEHLKRVVYGIKVSGPNIKGQSFTIYAATISSTTTEQSPVTGEAIKAGD